MKALEIVKPGLAKKGLIEQSDSFCFLNDCVVTYNDEISISHPVEGLNITGAIQADTFHRFLTKSKQEEIEIDITDTEVLIKAGKAKAWFTLKVDVALPLEEIEEQGEWQEIGTDVLSMIKMAVPYCSGNMVNPELTCVHVDGNGAIIAGDNMQLFRAEIPVMKITPFLLPASTAKWLDGYTPTHISGGKRWVHFKTEDGTILSCRVFDGKYPDPSAILAMRGDPITLPKALGEILDKAEIFAKRELDSQDAAELSLTSNGKLMIKAECESGRFEETARVKYDGEGFTVIVHPGMLRTIATKVRECSLGKTFMRFDSDNWTCMLSIR